MYDPIGFATDRRCHAVRKPLASGGHEPDGDELPFEAGAIVMGNVSSMREPVWQMVATARALGVDDVFESGGRNRPLMPVVAATCIAQLRAAIDKIAETREITPAPDLTGDLVPSPAGVRTALHGLRELFAIAVDRNALVETGVD
jgi:hypothetical protein